MPEFLSRLFSTDGFVPRWDCGDWGDLLGWFYIASDIGVWSAYTAIPAVLIYFVWRKATVPFRAVFVLFGAFILACGLTHLLDAAMFWWPGYRLLGLVEFLTAVISWGTVVALVPIVPRALAMRSPEELEREIEARRRVETDLQRLNHELEERIKARTAEIAAANTTLKSQREWFQTTLASIGDAVIATDTTGRVTFINPAAEALTGWSAAEANGQALEAVFTIINEATRKAAENPAARALAEGKIVGLANGTVLVSRTGGEHLIDDSAAPIRDAEGAMVGVVLVFRDVTERRQAELALRLSEERLRNADRRKDEFLAVLGHELRNPLAPIKNALELMKVETEQANVNWARDVMERQVDHMVRLVDDLLDVSRITQGKIALKLEAMELQLAVRHAIEEAKPVIDAAGHELIISPAPGPIWIQADPVRFAQIIANLLTNAAKYTQCPGKISLETNARDGIATITVSDTGLGIPPDMLDQVFLPFTQVHQGGDRARSGLGIGLALVRNLVEMHHGTVTAHSAGEGQGSTFIVRLPTIELPGDRAASTWQPSPVEPRRILVVDDNESAAHTLSVLLTRIWKHDVAIENDALLAIKKLEQFKPEIVFLDIEMPGATGLEIAARIRELPAGRSLLLVALTGYGQVADQQKSLEAGFDVHLVKPVSVRDLQPLFAHAKLSRRE